MITLDLNQRRTKILLGILLAILIAVIIFTVYSAGKQKNINTVSAPPVSKSGEGVKPLEPEQIQKALSQKVAPENQEKTEPLTTEEINKVLDQKLPESEVKPLSQAEIQQVLNAKAK